MEKTRNKFWRIEQEKRVFKARLKWLAAISDVSVENGVRIEHPHWFELAQTHWAKVYRATGTPCSCWMCRGEKYSRKDYKRDTQCILRLQQED